uniref:Uncharacterized protein n=1 Tax=Arundo donax TaxID=35708 RepID=A0A0A9DFS1_ARUDO
MTNGLLMKNVFVRLLVYRRSTLKCQMTEKLHVEYVLKVALVHL